MNKKVLIFGGGTVSHIANHLALCAPAYGKTARQLEILCKEKFLTSDVQLTLTKMAGGEFIETNRDVQEVVDMYVKDLSTKVIFFNCAIVDFEASYLDGQSANKYTRRLSRRSSVSPDLFIEPSETIISSIRRERKDIFLVGFKTTCNASKQEMYEKGLKLCKESSVNLVLVNDTGNYHNMIVTPEEAVYHEGKDRIEILTQLVDMAFYRSQLTFTQSTVVKGDLVKWNDERVPNSLREVVDYCRKSNAYKPFLESTVGHFAVKLSDTQFLTSIRKSDFNKLEETGLVYVETDGPDTVIAYGAKPSVGGQSQRIVFNDHSNMDCIVHFHCPFLTYPRDNIPVKSQREVECGSHECGKQTSEGLKQFGNLKCVMLDNHGPNIVFNKNIDSKEVIDFIVSNFDLSKKTGGYNL